MDEFIVPNMDLIKPSTQSLVNLIGQFKQPPRNKSSDSFLFKNSFFCGEFNNETVSDPYSEDNFDVFKYDIPKMVFYLLNLLLSVQYSERTMSGAINLEQKC